MVKIVELDETETVGLASAGIGLAGSELPNKRKKKKARPPLDPLGEIPGMGNGTGTGGPSPGTSEPLQDDEAKVPERPSANLATAGESRASAAPGGGDETIETPSTKKDFHLAAPSLVSILLTVLLCVATTSFAFYVTRTLATTLIAPYEREL